MNKEPEVNPEGFFKALIIGYLALRTYIYMEEQVSKEQKMVLTPEHGHGTVLREFENLEGEAFFEVLTETGKHVLSKSDCTPQSIAQ